MSHLFPRSFILFIALLAFSAIAVAQVVVTDDFETNNVGDLPAGWTQVNGSVGYALATGSPVASGARAVRLSSGLSTASTIRITTAITNDYVYEYYVLIPDTGLVNETIGSVKVENVGMSFALGATPSEGIIYFSNTSDGFVVPTNVYHHVKVEVDYQKNVLRTTVDGLPPKKYPASINTAQDLRLEATALSSVLQKHILYVDSVSVSLMTVDLTPAYTLLSSPADGATGLGASSAPSFSWTSVSLATGYTLQISTDSTFATGIVYDDTTITGTSKSVPLPPLVPATTYYWRVKAKNTIGWGDWSLVRRFRTVDPPDAPVLYSPSDATQLSATDDVYFSYSTPSGTQSYQLQIALDSLFATIVFNDSAASANSYQYIAFPPLQILNHYYWRVRSLATAGWGAWSSVFDFFTAQPLPPPALSSPANGFQSTDVNSVYLSWAYVSYATKYWLVIAKDSNFTTIVVNDSTQNSTGVYQYFPPLEFNTTYYWKVRTGSIAGWGAYSGWRSFRTKPTPPITLSSPANGSLEDDASVYFSGTTTYSDGVDSTAIQIALDSLFTQLVADSADAYTSYNVNIGRFTPGTTYYWRMRAHNVAGWGPYSSRRTIVIGAPPVAPTLSSPANNAVVSSLPVYFTWGNGAATNIQDYRLQIATDSLFTSLVVDTVFGYSGNYVGAPPLLVNTKYYWRVRTRTYVGSGSYSTARIFFTPQRPSKPVVVAPVSGTMDAFGTVTIRWQSTAGKDSSTVQLTLDTNAVAARVLARTIGGVSHNTTVEGHHYGPVYSGFADFPIQIAAADADPLTPDLTISGQGFSGFDMPAGTRVFFRTRDFSETGSSDWSSWSSFGTLRVPATPSGFLPTDGATGVPFIGTAFSIDPNIIANTQTNVTVSTFSNMTAPIFQDRLESEYSSSSNRLYAFAPDLNSNSTYFYQFTAYNGAGQTSTPIFSFHTADPAPIFTCAMDVPGDQGGLIDLDFTASPLDQGCGLFGDPLTSPICVFEYSAWRLHEPGSVTEWRALEIRQQVEKLPKEIREALAKVKTADLWEPLANFPAIGEASYRVMVRSRADSGKNGSGLQKFAVIAHALNGMLFRSTPAWAYSVDNLAPAPPVGGTAAVADGGLRVTWVANDEADLKEYVVYRSLNQNDPVSALTPIGTTTETTFFDPNPPQVAVAYYYVVARDKNDNNGDPAIITATIVTGVEALEGIPTEFTLGQNFPNPFNPTTTLRFGVPERSSVRVQVINTLGQVVEELIDTELPAGYFQTVWNAKVPSGMYFARMVAAPANAPEKRFSSIKKMVLLR